MHADPSVNLVVQAYFTVGDMMGTTQLNTVHPQIRFHPPRSVWRFAVHKRQRHIGAAVIGPRNKARQVGKTHFMAGRRPSPANTRQSMITSPRNAQTTDGPAPGPRWITFEAHDLFHAL